jgi:hypothetical protein
LHGAVQNIFNQICPLVVVSPVRARLEIEARRTGVYVLSDDERAAIVDARRGTFASDEDAAAFWKRHGLA